MIWLLWLPVTLAAPRVFPLVDPGLFVISGVSTCGDGGGYCLLGLDCTLDEDFLPDTATGQHCDGLRSAFTPSAHFVCCRATNKTIYKPPIAFPPGLDSTEPGTARTTTVDLLENEIDQVLLKVAESVNAVKKTPATEATESQTALADPAPELRDSLEAPAVHESALPEEGMVADSPAEDDDEEEDDVLEEAMQKDAKVRDPVVITPPANNEQSAQNTESKTVGILHELYNESPGEKATEENTISLGDWSDESTSESESQEVTSVTTDDRPLPKENVTKPEILINKDNENTPENIYTKDILKEENKIKEKASEHSVPKENIEKNDSISERPLQGKVNKNDTLNENTNSKENVEAEDLNKLVTKKPNLLTDQAKPQNGSHTDAEWTDPKSNKTSEHPTLQKFLNNQTNPSENPPLPNTSLNEIVMSTDNIKDHNNSLNNVFKKEKIPLSDEIEASTFGNTTTETNNTAGAMEDQFVTSSTVTPVTQTPDNGQSQSPEDVIQGQQEVDVPCSKEASGNCSKEVKFVFQNQTLCYGSIFSLDWIITSASCALRIFRAGMLNVSVSPLIDSQVGTIKTIIVHESYGENAGTTGQEIEAHNIGLVQLRARVREWTGCVSCLPVPGQQISLRNCSAITVPALSQSSQLTQDCSTSGGCKAGRDDAGASAEVELCRGPARLLRDDRGFHYLTLPCDTPWSLEPRYSDSGRRASGAPLFCDGLLAGLETSTGVGLLAFTPLAPYLPWLRRNTRPTFPSLEQTFNLG